ncbi:MAG: hypothetical protein ACOCTI_06895 [Phycisphaeraceae bacterium]
MKELHEGQCGLCTHFGEHHPQEEPLIQIRTQHEGPEEYLDECNHPQHEALHLKVSPISGCDGFEPAT